MRQIVVHSVLYYRFDESLIADHTFDAWCVELVRLIAAHPDIARAHPLWPLFDGFDGSTGFHLAGDQWGVGVAQRLLRSKLPLRRELLSE